jgi:hypothetical protein
MGCGCGKKTKRPSQPSNFDWQFYLDYYKDLRPAGIVTEQDANNHYTRYGRREKRAVNVKMLVGTNFKWTNYLKLNPDIEGINNEKDAILHYVQQGKPYGRKFI